MYMGKIEVVHVVNLDYIAIIGVSYEVNDTKWGGRSRFFDLKFFRDTLMKSN